MINQILRAKANYLLVGFFVLLSLCITTNTYANSKQDIAELEAFYHLVFDEKSKVKDASLAKKKNIQPKQRIEQPRKTTNTKKLLNREEKDPELVAFYESIFGKTVINPEKAVKPIAVIRPEMPNLETNSLKTVNSINTIQKKLNKQKKPIISSTEPLITQQKSGKAPKKQSEAIIKQQNIQNDTVATPIEEKPKIDIKNDKKTDKLASSSSSEKLNKSDTATLFAQAFGKKAAKVSSNNTSNKKNINANDMSSLFAKAFGKKSTISVPSNVSVDFRVNNSTLGDLKLFSDSSGSMSHADTKELLELLKEVLKDHVFLRVEKQLTNNNKTLLSELEQLGISAFYNSTNLSLDVDIKPELRKPRILSLLKKKKVSVRDENKVIAEKVSGYLNAFTNIGLNSGGEEADFRMRLEGSLNINNFVFETTGDYRNESFELGKTTLTYDKPEKLKRFALGNISTGGRNFQENIELDGIRISKEFFLDPDLQVTPRADESLHLDTDSEVELYINNQLIRRFYLKAGIYSLQDIGLYNGANNIRIRIKDEFGKVTVKRSKQYYDSHLLKPGLSLFAISVGYLSNKESYANNSLKKTPIFSGYYQKGISTGLTISLDAQLSSENYLLGAETISSIPIGSLKNSLAISGGKNRESGYATSFEFRPNRKQEQISLDTLRQDLLGLDTTSRGFLNNWSITGEFRSENFSTLNEIDSNLTSISQSVDDVNFGNRVLNSNKLKGNLQTNFNLNLREKWQGSLNLGVADYYDSDESYYANLSANKRFNNGMRLSIGGRYDTKDEFSMNLQLSIPLSKKKDQKRVDLDILTDSRDNAYETKLNVKPTSFIGKNSLGGSLEHFEDDDSRQQSLDVHYRSNIFESTLTARNRYNKKSEVSSQDLDIGFNTSIACAGTSCAPSYPLNNSFAIVSGPSNQTSPIALSNNSLRFKYSDGNDTGLPDNYTGLIPGKGKKAVVHLDSYRTQNINIDEGTLPNGYDSEKTEFSMFPKHRQAFLLKAGGEPATTLDGMLFDDLNNHLSFKGGQWIPINRVKSENNEEGKTVAFFSNKSGKFRVSSIPAGKYKLELFDYPDMEPIHINVPDTKGKVHDVGNLIINTPN